MEWASVKLVSLKIPLPLFRLLNLFTTSSTISRAPLPISSTVYHAVDVACFTLEKQEDIWGLVLASTVALSQATMQTNLFPDTSTMAVIVFQIWQFEPSVPFLVAMIAAKDMKCASFPNLALFTLLVLMNVLATFNAHLLCLTHFLIDSPSFLFFTHFVLCICLLVWYYIMQYGLHFFVYTLFWGSPSDWLLFCHVFFCINSYKNTRFFPRPLVLT